jgi:glycosyltransferase involved in cell wall biosynthesis
MKIVFCYQYCTLGGCETVLSTRMRELQSLGVETHVIFLNHGDGERLFKDLGDRVSICSQPSSLENKLEELKPDFIVSLDTPQACDYLEHCSTNARFVFEVHSTYAQALKQLKQMDRHRISALLTPSHAQRELVLSLLGENLQCPVEVVPNPLRSSFSVYTETPSHRRPIVIWVGRLDPHKNWRMFIEICRRVHAAGTDLEYWLVGTSKNSPLEKAQLWEQVKKAKLSDRFCWLPYVQYEKMDRLLRYVAGSGGCLVSTSRQESFGMAAAEAMASSCLVVVPDIGGFRDFVINDETGFRYPPGNLQAAVDCILKAVRDLATRRKIAAAGYQRVHDMYSARRAVLKLIDTLQHLEPLSK